MKKGIIFLILTITLIYSINQSYIVNADDDKISILATYHKDVIGDSQNEKIQVVKFSKENKIEIQIMNGKKIIDIIGVKGNQIPSIVLQDFTQDGRKDIFISKPQSKDHSQTNHQLYSFQNEKLSKISLPEELVMVAQLENNYKAMVQINQSGKAYTLDLRNKKKYFDKKGIYQKGYLNEPTELMVQPFETFKLVRLRDLTFGLKGRQVIDEGFDGEKIAFVDSTWKWINGNWELQNSVVKRIK
ncbi:hypothetical protein [Neobacillus sp. LXY-4]|uniref:hypothetical protein n=1 Tax=Neobacillus sp. LXY-4 TaxID=3379826 RepID=UPI003EE3EFF6